MEAPALTTNQMHRGLADVTSTSADFYWFSFGSYYYGSPASLVEQEVLTR